MTMQLLGSLQTCYFGVIGHSNTTHTIVFYHCDCPCTAGSMIVLLAFTEPWHYISVTTHKIITSFSILQTLHNGSIHNTRIFKLLSDCLYMFQIKI